MRDLCEAETRLLDQYICPYCKTTLLEGPSGGASQNLYCVNLGCQARFNYMGLLGAEVIQDPVDLDQASRDLETHLLTMRTKFEQTKGKT